jgi:hypothetical protein
MVTPDIEARPCSQSGRVVKWRSIVCLRSGIWGTRLCQSVGRRRRGNLEGFGSCDWPASGPASGSSNTIVVPSVVPSTATVPPWLLTIDATSATRGPPHEGTSRLAGSARSLMTRTFLSESMRSRLGESSGPRTQEELGRGRNPSCSVPTRKERLALSEPSRPGNRRSRRRLSGSRHRQRYGG